MLSLARSLAHSRIFEFFIIGVIVINCVLIGVETHTTTPLIHAIQHTALWIFLFEIIVRWLARTSVKAFFSDAWNVFDTFIVAVSFVPESWFADASMVTALRVLRVFRILRLLRTAREIKLIVSVLFRSFSTLSYNAIFFLIFMYLFSIIGVTLFRLPDPATATPDQLALLELYNTEAPGAPGIGGDPYRDLSETAFTLFRILTGEDWTDLRYNLNYASEIGLVQASPGLITAFHVIWFILAVFLLLNLLVGAIINNYQLVMDEHRNASKSPNGEQAPK